MALLTERAIMTAFGDMLEEMPFDKITVAALVRRADISSNTFYYHYSDIYALLGAWLRTVLTRHVDLETPDFDWSAATKTVLRVCRAHAKKFYHVFDCLSRDGLERYIFSLTDDVFYRTVCRRAEGRAVPEARLREITSFCRYAYVGFLMEFFWNRMEGNIEHGVTRLHALFVTFVDSALQEAE